MSKLKSLSVLAKIVKTLKGKGKKVVFTNGCFDLIHPGHIKILREAKKKGDILIVGLNSDESIKRIKGDKRPILNQEARAAILEGIEDIDYIIIFTEDTPYNIIQKLKPTYLVKGADWNNQNIIGKDIVKKVFRVILYPDYSTSAIIETIIKRYKKCD